MSSTTQESDSPEVQQLLSALSHSPAFAQLSTLVKEIATNTLHQFPPSAKEHLKGILCALVEEAAGAPAFGPRSSASQLPKREVKSVRSSRSSQVSKQSPVAQRHSPAAKSPMNSLQARSFEEMYSLVSAMQSEFTHVTGSATFGKAQRMKGPELSPGPADYQSDKLAVREKSPRVVIPQGGKRFDYIPDSCSPGPGRYYPMRRFVSK